MTTLEDVMRSRADFGHCPICGKPSPQESPFCEGHSIEDKQAAMLAVYFAEKARSGRSRAGVWLFIALAGFIFALMVGAGLLGR